MSGRGLYAFYCVRDNESHYRECRNLGWAHARDDLYSAEPGERIEWDEISGIVELALWLKRRPTDDELEAWNLGYNDAVVAWEKETAHD